MVNNKRKAAQPVLLRCKYCDCTPEWLRQQSALERCTENPAGVHEFVASTVALSKRRRVKVYYYQCEHCHEVYDLDNPRIQIGPVTHTPRCPRGGCGYQLEKKESYITVG